MSKTLYIPEWAREDAHSFLSYLCRVAAVTHSKQGTATVWASSAGVSTGSIDVSLSRGWFTAKIALKLINVLPEQTLNMHWMVEPDRFLNQEELPYGN